MTRAATTPTLTPDQWDTVLANTGLITHVLTKMRRTLQVDWDDAYQDGLLGLMRATQKYDPHRGYAFSTYAVTWIRSGIQRGRENAMGIGYRQHARHDLPGPYRHPLGIDVPSTNSDGTDGATIADRLAAPDDPTDIPDPTLPARLQRVLDEACGDQLDRAAATHYTDGTSLRDIADTNGVSHEHIRRRVARLRGILRHPLAGLDEQPWAQHAACHGAPVADHFPGKGAAIRPDVKRRCFGCPVRQQCTEAAVDLLRGGYRGARTAVQIRTRAVAA